MVCEVLLDMIVDQNCYYQFFLIIIYTITQRAVAAYMLDHYFHQLFSCHKIIIKPLKPHDIKLAGGSQCSRVF